MGNNASKGENQCKCEYYKKCLEALTVLNITEQYFDTKSEFCKCYCDDCHSNRKEADYYRDGQGEHNLYTKPLGWGRVMLHLPTRAQTLQIFDKWNAAYHGTTAACVQPILDSGMFMLPGDNTLHGKTIREQPGHWNDDCKPAGADTKQIFVSPSMKYAGHGVYAKKRSMALIPYGLFVNVRVAFQVRIQPDCFSVGPETIGLGSDEIDPPIDNQEIEWSTNVRDSIIPTALLLKIEEDAELRLVMIGIAGSGKSATANSIFGEVKFDEIEDPVNESKECCSASVKRKDLTISITDTVGLQTLGTDSYTSFKFVSEMLGCMSPGPHAILVTVEGNHVTQEMFDTIEEFRKMLGHHCIDYMIFVFTHGDLLVNRRAGKTKTFKEYCEELRKNSDQLDQLLTKCGNRYVSFNNRLDLDSSENEDQTKQLITMVLETINKNEGRCCQSSRFEKIEEIMEEIDKTTNSRQESRGRFKQLLVKDTISGTAALTIQREQVRARPLTITDSFDQMSDNAFEILKTSLSQLVE